MQFPVLLLTNTEPSLVSSSIRKMNDNIKHIQCLHGKDIKPASEDKC
uniref:Uncharacterized protein n=1 Tax=Anguilla anguilla TaxID=7936 RepID=A0A0E9SA61_ANGAN